MTNNSEIWLSETYPVALTCPECKYTRIVRVGDPCDVDREATCWLCLPSVLDPVEIGVDTDDCPF